MHAAFEAVRSRVGENRFLELVTALSDFDWDNYYRILGRIEIEEIELWRVHTKAEMEKAVAEICAGNAMLEKAAPLLDTWFQWPKKQSDDRIWRNLLDWWEWWQYWEKGADADRQEEYEALFYCLERFPCMLPLGQETLHIGFHLKSDARLLNHDLEAVVAAVLPEQLAVWKQIVQGRDGRNYALEIGGITRNVRNYEAGCMMGHEIAAFKTCLEAMFETLQLSPENVHGGPDDFEDLHVGDVRIDGLQRWKCAYLLTAFYFQTVAAEKRVAAGEEGLLLFFHQCCFLRMF
ncbi:MAG: hypothetical protein AAF570_25970 [Bacteroidota bacterium]